MFTLGNMPTASDTRRRILQAAQQLYLEGGSAALTMRAVGDRVGVSATALYRHFRNKSELLATVVEDGLEVFGTYLQRSLAAPTPYDRLLACGDEYVRFALERRPYYEVLFMSGAKLELGDEVDCIQEHRSSSFQVVVDRVAECMSAGVFRPDDAYETARIIWATSHGLVGLFYEGLVGPDPEDFRQVHQRDMQRLFTGLFTASGPPK